MTSLFFVTLLLSFAIIDISTVYLAKRELINIGEAAISRAAHNVDLDRYYSGDRVQAGMGANGPTYLLPIDCSAAGRSLESELASISFHNHPITVTDFSCIGDVIHTTISTRASPPLSLPLLGAHSLLGAQSVVGSLEISATLSASNILGR